MKSNTKTAFKRKLTSALVGAVLVSSTSVVWSRGEVTEAAVSFEAVTPVSYTQAGTIYNWGTRHNLILDGFTYQNQAYVFDADAVDRVEIQRVDNANATGTRCNLFVEVAGDGFVYAPAYPGDAAQGQCDLEGAISDNVFNVDPLDVFTNVGPRPDSINNIERVDYITNNGISTGLTSAHLDAAGVAVIEKAGNNLLKLAVITALDSNGAPASYGDLVQIDRSYGAPDQIRYGVTDIELPMHYMANKLGADSGNVTFTADGWESMGIVFVSQKDLGLTTGQTYYGFSIFAADVDASVHTLTQPSTFPRDTTPVNLSAGDADFSAASAFLALNNAPIAKDDSATTLTSQAVTIDILANDNDPDGDALIITIITGPQNGSVSIVNNELVFTPDDGFTGSDSITYQIDDGNGGRDSATVIINVGTGNASPIADDDIADTDINQSVAVDILENDSDPDGDTLTVTLLGQPQNGTAEWNGTELIYTPDNGFSGSDSLQYQISDGNGGQDTATVNLSVATVLAGASGRIETGLNGHGAGSLNAIMLLFLGVFGLFRVRARNDR